MSTATAGEEKTIAPYHMGNATLFDNGTITVDVHPRGVGCDAMLEPIKAALEADTIQTSSGEKPLSDYVSARYRNNLGHGWVETTFKADELEKAGGDVNEAARKVDAAVTGLEMDGTFETAVFGAVPEIRIKPLPGRR